MTPPTPPSLRTLQVRWRGHRRRGFTIVEAALSSVLVGVMVVASLQALGAAQTARAKTAISLRAHLLADDLLAEMLRKPYADPSGSALIGREAAESVAARSALNDVDDYHGLSEEPPTAPDGAVIPGFGSWGRTVSVAWCAPANPNADSMTETGVKRITVNVQYKKDTILTTVALKANIP